MLMKYSLVLPLALCGFLFGVTCRAQSPDIAQLKDKLQQLEQMLQDVKSQIAATEQAQKTPAAPVAETKSPNTSVAPPLVPVEHIGDETRTRDLASTNADSAPRINNEPMDPALR